MSDDAISTKPTALVALAGKYAHKSVIVDVEDLPLVQGVPWYRSSAPGSLTEYAKTKRNGRDLYIHRLIMNPPPGLEINHIDGNGLNNSKANLEIVTRSQNIRAVRTRRAYDAWKEIEKTQTAVQTAPRKGG